MKVPWTEHKTNEEILKMIETERKIMEKSTEEMAGSHPETCMTVTHYCMRMTLEGQIQGGEGLRLAYGRPRTMLLGWLLKTEEEEEVKRTKDVRPCRQGLKLCVF